MNEDEMVCQQLVEAVTNYLEGALPEAERRAFEDHLSECDGCRAFVDQVRTTIALSGRIDAEELPPERRAELVLMFRGWRDGQIAGDGDRGSLLDRALRRFRLRR
jgi:anti-sigma factor RsiW